LSLDGLSRSAAEDAEKTAQKFSLSLDLPVYLQDERLTSVEARERLLAEGHKADEIKRLIDSEAAAVILRDFIAEARNSLPIQSHLP
jgi:putative Holliday junction resolvase